MLAFRKMVGLSVLLGLALLASCGTVRETLPPRSAMEQLLVSTAADRAVGKMGGAELGGRRVFIDTSNLDSYDKPYVVQRVRDAVLREGAALVQSRQEAEVILEVASGALSMDKRSYLFGLPAIPLPVPLAGETLSLPELPLFKVIFYTGKAKLLFTAVDAATGRQVLEVGTCHGRSKDSYWWLLLFGPIRSTDLPEGGE